jgi:hypothetical protein
LRIRIRFSILAQGHCRPRIPACNTHKHATRLISNISSAVFPQYSTLVTRLDEYATPCSRYHGSGPGWHGVNHFHCHFHHPRAWIHKTAAATTRGRTNCMRSRMRCSCHSRWSNGGLTHRTRAVKYASELRDRLGGVCCASAGIPALSRHIAHPLLLF